MAIERNQPRSRLSSGHRADHGRAKFGRRKGGWIYLSLHLVNQQLLNSDPTKIHISFSNFRADSVELVGKFFVGGGCHLSHSRIGENEFR